MADPKNNLDYIEFAQRSPEERVCHVEQWPSFAQMSPEEQEQFRNTVRDASPIEADWANTEARCAVWGEEVGPEEAAPKAKPKRKSRPATEVKRMERDTGKIVTSYTAPDGATYRFGEATEQQCDTDRELAEFEKRHGKA